MESLNIQRQGLLLELVRNITQNNTAGYSDEDIYNNIKDYQELLDNYKANKKIDLSISFKDKEKLNKLHKYFYGENFNFEDSSQNLIGRGNNVFEEFANVYRKIEELATTKDQISSKLLESLKEILGTVVYSNSKTDKQIMDYLNLVNMTLHQYKPSVGTSKDSINKSLNYVDVSKFEENRQNTSNLAIKAQEKRDGEIQKKKEELEAIKQERERQKKRSKGRKRSKIKKRDR